MHLQFRWFVIWLSTSYLSNPNYFCLSVLEYQCVDRWRFDIVVLVQLLLMVLMCLFMFPNCVFFFLLVRIDHYVINWGSYGFGDVFHVMRHFWWCSMLRMILGRFLVALHVHGFNMGPHYVIIELYWFGGLSMYRVIYFCN